MIDWTKRLWQRCRSGLLPLFLLLSVTACSTAPARPPEALLRECSVADVQARHALETNGEILAYVGDLKAALRACNADKAALRAWDADVQGEP